MSILVPISMGDCGYLITNTLRSDYDAENNSAFMV